MKYRFIRGPFMLTETVYMLYKFVNQLSFHDVLSRLRRQMGEKVPEKRAQVLRRLQQILDQVCDGLDPQDPQLQRFFLQDEIAKEMCLANAMVLAFELLSHRNLYEAAQSVCGQWKECQEAGYWIHPKVRTVLYITGEPGYPGDLFQQILNLEVSPVFKLKLYEGLRNFDKTMEELLELIVLPARQLEQIYKKEAWLFESVEEDWQQFFEQAPPHEFITQFFEGQLPWDSRKELWIAVSMMQSDRMLLRDSRNHRNDAPYETLFIGSGVATRNLTLNAPVLGVDKVSAVMKSLSDRKRLEIVRRLNKGESYVAELATAMNMDPGNMSRTLSQLCSQGFLSQEWRDTRCYYRTDRESILCLLRTVEQVLLD